MYVTVVTYWDEPWDIRVYGPYVRKSTAIAKANKLDADMSHSTQRHTIGYYKLRKV